jgi:hypothetical protein
MPEKKLPKFGKIIIDTYIFNESNFSVILQVFRFTIKLGYNKQLWTGIFVRCNRGSL